MSREYDYDTRDYERSQTRSSNSTLWIVLAVVGGILLVCGGGIAGVGFLVYYAVKSAREKIEVVQKQVQEENEIALAQGAANDFLSDLRFGLLDAAYNNKTSEGFRRRKNLFQFKQFVDVNPAFKTSAFPQITMQRPAQATSATAKVTLQNNLGQQVNATIQLVKENGIWKVDDVTIP
jgi:hypothetical protein